MDQNHYTFIPNKLSFNHNLCYLRDLMSHEVNVKKIINIINIPY